MRLRVFICIITNLKTFQKKLENFTFCWIDDDSGSELEGADLYNFAAVLL